MIATIPDHPEEGKLSYRRKRSSFLIALGVCLFAALALWRWDLYVALVFPWASDDCIINTCDTGNLRLIRPATKYVLSLCDRDPQRCHSILSKARADGSWVCLNLFVPLAERLATKNRDPLAIAFLEKCASSSNLKICDIARDILSDLREKESRASSR